jgi:hypothetical protein
MKCTETIMELGDGTLGLAGSSFSVSLRTRAGNKNTVRKLGLDRCSLHVHSTCVVFVLLIIRWWRRWGVLFLLYSIHPPKLRLNFSRWFHAKA